MEMNATPTVRSALLPRRPPPALPSPAPEAVPARNVGPGWGMAASLALDRYLPEPVFKIVRAVAAWVIVASLPIQRKHSRDYLRLVLQREPTWADLYRHFRAFGEMCMLRLRFARGYPQRGVLSPDSTDFMDFLHSGDQAMLGTFHLGHSDLVGFLFGTQEQRRIFMIRHRVANSRDTDELARAYGKWVSYIWVNDGENLVFALKDAIAAGGSIALKCDRLYFSAKTESFDFLGARRIFPFTLYHLALIFKLPVILSIGVPGKPGETVIHSAPRWDPDPELSRKENLERAQAHFQAFLARIERVLRANPYLWFNFVEMNPVDETTNRTSVALKEPHSADMVRKREARESGVTGIALGSGAETDRTPGASGGPTSLLRTGLRAMASPGTFRPLVLIPSYNTGRRLLSTVVEALEKGFPILVVIDGSTDGSERPVIDLARRTAELEVIVRPRNGGKGAAVLTGTHRAIGRGYTHILAMDADGQHPATHISSFFEAAEHGPEALIAGVPQFGPEAPKERMAGHRLCVRLAAWETLNAGVIDPLFGFRVYPTVALRDTMERTRTGRGFDFDPEIAVRLAWSGIPTVNLPAPCRYLSRAEGGVSHFNYVRDNLKMVRLHARLAASLLLNQRHLRAVAARNRKRAEEIREQL